MSNLIIWVWFSFSKIKIPYQIKSSLVFSVRVNIKALKVLYAVSRRELGSIYRYLLSKWKLFHELIIHLWISKLKPLTAMIFDNFSFKFVGVFFIHVQQSYKQKMLNVNEIDANKESKLFVFKMHGNNIKEWKTHTCTIFPDIEVLFLEIIQLPLLVQLALHEALLML
jgi:hypothetical protein